MKIPCVLKMGEMSTQLAKGKLMPADLEETVSSCYWTVPPPCSALSTSSLQPTWWFFRLVSRGLPQLWNKDASLKLPFPAQAAYKLQHYKQNN